MTYGVINDIIIETPDSVNQNFEDYSYEKALRITGRILLILMLLLLLFTLVTFIIHRVKTNQEVALLKEKGYYNPVSVGDHCLNIAKFGNENGKHTVVALDLSGEDHHWRRDK